MDIEEMMARVLKVLAAFVIGVAICAVLTCLMGCRSVKYVSVPEYHTEYKVRTDSFVRRDTAWVHDSVSVWMHGDTVWKEKYKTRYEYKYVYRNVGDTILKTDSVRVPYPVERKLGWWEQKKVDYFVPVCVVCGIFFVSLLLLIRRCIRRRRNTE